MTQKPIIGQLAEKSRDPFYYLPVELAERICQMLSIHNRLSCLRVCKSWNIMLQSLHSLWKILDLRDSHRYVPMDGLQAYLKRSDFSLNRAEIQLGCFVDNDKLEYIIENCKCLKELKIFGHDWRGNMTLKSLSSAKQIMLLYMGCQIPTCLSVVISTLKSCQDTLVDVTFGNLDRTLLNTSDWPNLHNLKSLCLGESDHELINFEAMEEANIDLDDLVQATPNLITVIIKHLRVKNNDKVYDLSLWKHLQRLEFINNKLKRFPQLPQTLRHLIFDGNYALSIPEIQLKELTQLPLLESFSCQSTAISPRGLFAVTKSCIETNNLKTLHLGNRIYDLKNHTLPVWLEYPPSASVEELSLAWMELDDEGVFRILMLYPKLKRIILSGNTITEATLQTLSRKKSIERIVIDNCFEIGPDEIKEIKDKGIEISQKFVYDALDDYDAIND